MTTVGRLEVGTAASPIQVGRTAEIVIANTPLGGGVADPEQFGNAILNFGKLTIHGAVVTPTFVRVAVEPRAGHTTFTLSEAVSGWKAGDRLVLPDTRHMKESETNGWMNNAEPVGGTDRSVGVGRRQHRLADERAGVRSPGRAQSQRRARVPPARREPVAQRHHPLRECDGHSRPHDVAAYRRHRHSLCAVPRPRAHQAHAAQHHHQRDRPLSDPHASQPRAAAEPGERLPVHRDRQRRGRRLAGESVQVGHRRSTTATTG